METKTKGWELGDYLASLRGDMSQHEAAKLPGVPSQGYQSKVEGGVNRNPSPAVLAEWVQALGGDVLHARDLLAREQDRVWDNIIAAVKSTVPGLLRSLAFLLFPGRPRDPLSRLPHAPALAGA